MSVTLYNTLKQPQQCVIFSEKLSKVKLGVRKGNVRSRNLRIIFGQKMFQQSTNERAQVSRVEEQS